MESTPYLMRLFRWWWLVAAAVVVAALSSYVSTRDQPALYQTSTTLTVGRYLDNPNPSGGELGLSQQLAQAYAEISRRPHVRQATMAALGLNGLPPYVVRPVPNTHLLEIVVMDSVAERAQAVADELARQLIALSPAGSEEEQSQRQAFVDQELNDLEASITTTKNEITVAEGELAEMVSARQIADTAAQIAGLQAKLNGEQANYAALLASTKRGATNALSVFEPAALPRAPMPSGRMSDIALASAIGLVLASGGAYFLEYMDDTIRGPGDLLAALDTAAIATIPQDRRRRGSKDSAAREGYRMLAGRLAPATGEQRLRRFLVTGASPGAGSANTAAGLGVALAQAGHRVLIVDADLATPRLHALFGLDNSSGLTTILGGQDLRANGALKSTDVPGLTVLPAGPTSKEVDGWSQSPRTRELLAHLDGLADIVLCEAPSLASRADALMLAGKCDGVLLVVEAGRTRRGAARQALDALLRSNVPVLGPVLNESRARVPRH